MKSYILILAILCLSVSAFAQQTLNASITHDGAQRDYILYVPAMYSGNEPVPLILNFHGYGSNATQQMWYGDFRSIADTVGFIVVHPEGLRHNGTTHWNVGGWIIGSPVDDVSFTAALLDTLSSEFNIDATRVYSTGMSNGGFMSFLLACQLSDKIAAVASVTGSMTPQTYSGCAPQHPTPVLQIHGTSDGVVPYNGAAWTNSIDNVMQYWVNYNNCNPFPSITSLPDIDMSDGSTVEHTVYSNGDLQATTEHFKVTGGDHTWPGSAIPQAGMNHDIDASAEIWKFFSRYDINGAINTAIDDVKALSLSIYPNPVQSRLHIDFKTIQQVDYQLVTLAGQVVSSGMIHSDRREIDVRHLPVGMYVLKVGGVGYKVLKGE